MSMHLLAAPHRLQEEDAGCLAACAQTVLSYWGIEQTQTRLNLLLGLTSIGVPFRKIQRLSAFGVSVSLQTGGKPDLCDAIDHKLPPILFVMTGHLPYWQDNTSHTVVMVGYDDAGALLADPLFADAPQRVGWEALLLAWSEHDYTFALVTR